MKIIKIVEVDEYGRPQKCICPECGQKEDKKDKRYENYLFNLLKEVFPVYLEDYPGMKMCPIEQWDIPEKDRIKVAEFTIQLYRQRG